MNYISKCVYTRVLLVISLILPAIAFASSYTPVSSGTNVVSLQGQDMLNIPQPNQAGISIARFSEFSVVAKPLKIVNAFDQQSAVPTTVVIIAPSINVQNSVEIMGAAADLVFVSEASAGQISCTGCTFLNLLRLAMIIGEPSSPLGPDSVGLGEFATGSTGGVSISGLSAPGLMAIDILAPSLHTSGAINFHQKANKSSLGGYETNSNGKFKIGSSTFSAMLGNYTWNYDTQVVQGNQPTAVESVIGGTLTSVGVKVSASGPLSVSGRIDTRTDLLTSIRYRGYPVISQEMIILESHSSDDLEISGDLYSSGQVYIRGTENVYLAASSDINSASVELIAGKTLTQDAYVFTSKYTEMAGQHVINEGYVESKGTISVYAKNALLNRYGGALLAETVNLEADRQSGLIINGSRTPYKSFSDVLLPIDQNYFSKIDPTKMGAYYTHGIHKKTNLASEQMPTFSSAHIHANTITVSARAFENINPYYEIVSEDEIIQLNRDYVTQVSVIAENTLKVDTEKYILNSSAHLGVESPTGTALFDSGVITNERYRVLFILDMDTYYSGDEFSHTGGYTVVETTTEEISTKVAAYSPPGLLFSMGNFGAKADSLFLNSTAYFEVFGDAVFSMPYLIDAGIKNRSVVKDFNANYFYGSGGQYDVCDPCLGSSQSYVSTDPKQLDSLFFINGNAFAQQTEQEIFTDFSPFDGYVNQVIDDIISDEYAFVGQFNNFYDPRDDVYVTLIEGVVDTYAAGGSYDLETDELTISWFEDRDYYGIDASPQGRGASISGERREGAQTYSIFDELKSLLARLASSIASLWNEITWWN